MNRTAVIVVVIVVVILLIAPRVFGATVMLPSFIEAHDCGTIHTLHEPIAGPVLMTERGSRRYVCGPYPKNPIPHELLADLKGPQPEMFVDEYLPVTSDLPVPAAFQLDRRGEPGGSTFPRVEPPFFQPPTIITVTEPPREPETPVETPTPVPLPSAAWLMLAAFATLSITKLKPRRSGQ